MKSAKSRKPSRSPALGAFLCLCASALLSGCTVVAVTATAVWSPRTRALSSRELARPPSTFSRRACSGVLMA